MGTSIAACSHAIKGPVFSLDVSAPVDSYKTIRYVQECAWCGEYIPVTASHECALAIVGSVTLGGNPNAEQAIRDAFDRHDPGLFVSGGAEGIDKMAEAEADRRGVKKIICYPTFRRWEPKGFKERNKQIANLCDHLVRIYDRYSHTYGSGWTADYAERNGKQVERILVKRAVPQTVA